MIKSKQAGEKPRRVTPPSPSYMNNDEFAAYLTGLRNNRVARPGGARPFPSSASSTSSHDRDGGASCSAPTGDTHVATAPSLSAQKSGPRKPATRWTSQGSISSRRSMTTSPDPVHEQCNPTTPLKPSEVVPSATYMERGQRWMEREEAGSLRQAMEDMNVNDLRVESQQDGEKQVYDAALNEASELVWQHRHGREPQPHAPYRYKPHMRKNSYQHARAASIGNRSYELASDGFESVSRSSTDSDGVSREDRHSANPSEMSHPGISASHASAYGCLQRDRPSLVTSHSCNRRSSVKRNISGEVQRPFSGDQIWEEPEAGPNVVAHATRDPGQRSPLRAKREDTPKQALSASRPSPRPAISAKRASPVDAPQEFPFQSRNPQYTRNTPVSQYQKAASEILKKNGFEIRGNDIRDATSMRLKDRSAKLPTPSAVSDNPDRPIVSFDADWTAPEETTDHRPGSSGRGPYPKGGPTSGQTVAIPFIMVAGEDDTTSKGGQLQNAPSIMVEDTQATPDASPCIPVIVTSEEDTSEQQTPVRRPLPTPAKAAYKSPFASQSRPHWSPAPRAGPRSTATCHECGFSIEGRVVALSGVSQRFHPQCFRCFACGTGLEALEISPEPDIARGERIDRIKRRANGETLEEVPGKTMEEDGDDRLRFYCHLDWHELFAPRCKHCKTPILGEHVVALGEHWHYGHFFCAECGDPFNQGMTHIEKDGYAWCINCQTKRTERRAPKCKMCRHAVIGQYIQALGGEWHDECFRCASCEGAFDDGQIFPTEQDGRMVILCTSCRAQELKF